MNDTKKRANAKAQAALETGIPLTVQMLVEELENLPGGCPSAAKFIVPSPTEPDAHVLVIVAKEQFACETLLEAFDLVEAVCSEAGGVATESIGKMPRKQ